MSKNVIKRKAIEIAQRRNDKEYEWVRTVISTLGIVLGLIISLKKDVVVTPGQAVDLVYHAIAVAAVLSTLLSICAGVIFLYADSDTDHLLVDKTLQHVHIYEEGNQPTPVVDIVQVARKKIFDNARICFFVSLGATSVCLFLYASYHDLRILFMQH